MLRIRWRWSQARAFDARAEREAAAKHFGARHWRRALRAYRRLAEHDPSDSFVQIRLGDCALQLHLRSAAEDAYRMAMAGYSRLGDWTKAVAACRLLVALCPDDADLSLHLASLESRRRRGALACTPELLTPPARPAGKELPAIDLRCLPDGRPFDLWAGEGIDLEGPAHSARNVDERGWFDDAGEAEERPAQRGALRTQALLVAVEDEPPVPDTDDAMPEEVFEGLYGTLSSSGAMASAFEATLRHRPALPASSAADEEPALEEPCTCGRCHICRPTTRRWSTR